VDLCERPDHAGPRHPWELCRFEFFRRVLATNGVLDAATTVLDVGAGDAWFADQLAARSSVQRIVCWDAAYTPDYLSQRPGESDRVELRADEPAGRFDLILLLDVLEHVEEATGFLAQIVRDHLAIGGHVLFSVPAWPLLFSSHDVRLRHYRRYTPSSARALAASAGLDLVCSAGLFHSLLIPRAIEVARERILRTTRPLSTLEWNRGRVATTLARTVLASDASLSLIESRLGWSLPGISWWALGHRVRSQGRVP
jgi:SAM-dependent methyltransferase